MALPPIKVKVSDSKQVYFEGEVQRISSFNEMGPFDIYPMHANFISIIEKELSLYQNHQKIKELKLEKAILKIKKDEAHIFLGIETLMMDDETASPNGDATKDPTAPKEK